MELDQPSLGRQAKGTSLLGLLGIAGLEQTKPDSSSALPRSLSELAQCFPAPEPYPRHTPKFFWTHSGAVSLSFMS